MKQLDEQGLLDLKRKIDTAKTSVSELKGHQTALMNQLKTDYGCKTVEEAEKKLKAMGKKITDLEDQIDEDIKELEDKYNKEDEE
jgi:predicted  nucleic acid-binding Zn-ribbon protein